MTKILSGYTRKDIMDALLDENKKYTKAEADTLLEKYMKGKVK